MGYGDILLFDSCPIRKASPSGTAECSPVRSAGTTTRTYSPPVPTGTADVSVYQRYSSHPVHHYPRIFNEPEHSLAQWLHPQPTRWRSGLRLWALAGAARSDCAARQLHAFGSDQSPLVALLPLVFSVPLSFYGDPYLNPESRTLT